jgi:hypothetical protein
MRASVLAAIAGAFFLGACSSTDLAAFAVGMQEANGTYWPDQSEWPSQEKQSPENPHQDQANPAGSLIKQALVFILLFI